MGLAQARPNYTILILVLQFNHNILKVANNSRSQHEVGNCCKWHVWTTVWEELKDPLGSAHAALDVQGANVLPVLLEQ